jgi:hypothetical protein
MPHMHPPTRDMVTPTDRLKVNMLSYMVHAAYW